MCIRDSAYGTVALMDGYEKTVAILEKTIDNYESAYQSQWNDFPDEYKMRMSKGIVAFELTVSDLQAKQKLSQNRSESEKQRIMAALAQSEDTNGKLIADFMQKLD